MDAAHRLDFLIIGAGIAGASVAAWLAPRAQVAVLEAEAQPGYHSTGRSAAAFIASYGPPGVRALSRASLPFFRNPPAGFADHALLQPRGLLTLVKPEHADRLAELPVALASEGVTLERWSIAQAAERVPTIRAERFAAALFEPDACDMDVHAIHQGYLNQLRRAGGALICDARVETLTRSPDGWQVTDQRGRSWQAAVLINAAGAWADRVAGLACLPPLGLQPMRRSAFVFAPPADLDVHDWPLLMSSDESWYIKPDAGLLLGSPANADPTEPQDVQPELLDIAAGIDRIEQDLALTVGRPKRTWAGLRTFSPDGELVGGFDPLDLGFFWVAGQGGYGIQTSAAMGRACARLALREPLDADLIAAGVQAERLSPARMRQG
ncbi:MAG: NAD(P)/FAD-dependent oxidoreductase [Leptothrix sp. (in: b-proteobacteria)]